MLRGLKPTGLVLLMTRPVSSSFFLAKLSNPSSDLGPSWTGTLEHFAMSLMNVLSAKAAPAQAALQCWEQWLLALLRGKVRAKNWEFIENKAVCSIATFEYWNKLPCTPVYLCLLDKVSILIKCQCNLKILWSNPQPNTFSCILFFLSPFSSFYDKTLRYHQR